MIREALEPSSPGLRWLLTATCVSYMAVLVWTTHAPSVRQPEIMLGAIPPDKLLHFTAYALLGMLVVITVYAWKRMRLRTLLVIFAALVFFALADESTQPFFGRTAEILDWVADVVGAAAALAVMVVCWQLWNRLKVANG